MHELIVRLLLENSSKNRDYPSGRELCGLLAANNEQGPLFFADDVKMAYEQATGWEKFEGAKTIYATSFCRADTKEIAQAAAQVKYLEKLGLPHEDQKILYFIDPYSHTTDELLESMARDYALDPQTLKNLFINPISKSERDSGQLPVAMQKPPTVELISELGLPNEITQLMLDALAVKPKTLGDWRIELDRISAKRVFTALGIDSNLINVASFEEILADPSQENGLTINSLAQNVKEAHESNARKIANYSGRNGDAIFENMPAILSIVGKNKEKILFLANGELNFIIDGQRYNFADISKKFSEQDVTYYTDLQQKINTMSIYEALKLGGVQLSGFGYYETLSLSLEENCHQNTPTAMIILDDYENPDGPVSAVMHTQQKGALYGVSSIKPLIGFNGDFGSAPDLTMLMLLSKEDMSNISAMIKHTADCMKNHDTTTFAGVNIIYDTQSKKSKVTSAGAIDRVAIKRLIEIFQLDATIHNYSFDTKIHPQLPMFVATWHPENLEKAMDGNFHDIHILKRKILGLDKLLEILGSLKYIPSHSMLDAINTIKNELNSIIESREMENASSQLEYMLIGEAEGTKQLALHRLQAVWEVYEENGIELPSDLTAEYSRISDKEKISDVAVGTLNILENKIRSAATNVVKNQLEAEIKQSIDLEHSSDIKKIQQVNILLQAKNAISGIESAFDLASIEKFITSNALIEAISAISQKKGDKVDWSSVMKIAGNGIQNEGCIRSYADKQLSNLNALYTYVISLQNTQLNSETNVSELIEINGLRCLIDTELGQLLTSMNLLQDEDPKNKLNPKKLLNAIQEAQKKISSLRQRRIVELLEININNIDSDQLRDHISGKLYSLASEKLDGLLKEKIKLRWTNKNIAKWGEEIMKEFNYEKGIQGYCSLTQANHRMTIEDTIHDVFLPEYKKIWNDMVQNVFENTMSFI
jgi:hypothetical protein